VGFLEFGIGGKGRKTEKHVFALPSLELRARHCVQDLADTEGSKSSAALTTGTQVAITIPTIITKGVTNQINFARNREKNLACMAD
jgi:hypothetical protein